MKTPTKEQYNKALETVKKYEERQVVLDKLNKDIGACLKQFKSFKFDVDEDRGIVTFSGVTDKGELRLTKAQKRNSDKFDEIIGKLIAVKKASNEVFTYVEKHIEKESLGIHVGIADIRDVSIYKPSF